MKYLYKVIWKFLFRVHVKILSAIFPFMRWIYSKIDKSSGKRKAEDWKRNFNDAVVQFPDGILDWYAFSIVLFILLVPLMLFTVKFMDYLYSDVMYVYALFGGVAILAYYILFYRNIDWLTKNINEIKRKADNN